MEFETGLIPGQSDKLDHLARFILEISGDTFVAKFIDRHRQHCFPMIDQPFVFAVIEAESSEVPAIRMVIVHRILKARPACIGGIARTMDDADIRTHQGGKPQILEIVRHFVDDALCLGRMELQQIDIVVAPFTQALGAQRVKSRHELADIELLSKVKSHGEEFNSLSPQRFQAMVFLSLCERERIKVRDCFQLVMQHDSSPLPSPRTRRRGNSKYDWAIFATEESPGQHGCAARDSNPEPAD